MHKNKFILLTFVVFMPLMYAKPSWPGMDFDEILEFFHQQFEQFDRQCRGSRKPQKHQPIQAIALPTITAQATIPVQKLTAQINEADEKVVIQIDGLNTQEIEARINDEQTTLMLYTPHEKIEIELTGNYIEVSTTQQQAHEQRNQGTYFGQSSSTIGQQVTGDPQLINQTIEYDPETSCLTITLPKQKIAKKDGTSVPVTIKQK